MQLLYRVRLGKWYRLVSRLLSSGVELLDKQRQGKWVSSQTGYAENYELLRMLYLNLVTHPECCNSA